MTDLRQIEREEATNAYVEELRAEVARLQKQCNEQRRVIDLLCAKSAAEAERLRAENEDWYQAALKWLRDETTNDLHELIVARRALEHEP